MRLFRGKICHLLINWWLWVWLSVLFLWYHVWSKVGPEWLVTGHCPPMSRHPHRHGSNNNSNTFTKAQFSQSVSLNHTTLREVIHVIIKSKLLGMCRKGMTTLNMDRFNPISEVILDVDCTFEISQNDYEISNFFWIFWKFTMNNEKSRNMRSSFF